MGFRKGIYLIFIPFILSNFLGLGGIPKNLSLSRVTLRDNAFSSSLQSSTLTKSTSPALYGYLPYGSGETQTDTPETTASSGMDVSITGSVSTASGVSLPNDMKVVLYLYNSVRDELVDSQETTVLGDGTFRFDAIKGENNITFLTSTSYQNIVYYSKPVAFDPAVNDYSLPITVYATTVDQTNLSVTQLHIQFDFSTAGKITIQNIFVVVNSGFESVSVATDGTSIPFIQIPQGAEEVQFNLAGGSSSPAQAKNGFALLPGVDKQYGIIATYSFPFSNTLNFSQELVLPVKTVSIVAPEGILIKSKQLSDAGTSISDGTTYHLYQADNLVAGSSLSMTISGKPGETAGLIISTQTVYRIILGLLGFLLIALGIILYFQNRKNSLAADDAERSSVISRDGIGRNPDDIMDAIIALEEKYKQGHLSRETFLRKRDELKKRLIGS